MVVGSGSAVAATGSEKSTAGIGDANAGMSGGSSAANKPSAAARKRPGLDAGLSEEAARRARKRRVKETAPAVKDMLKPLYAAKTLNKVRLHVAPLTGGNRHLRQPRHVAQQSWRQIPGI